MEQRSQLAEVSAEIRAAIADARLPSGFANAISESLQLGGRILAAEPLAYWARTLFASAKAAGLADWRRAIPAAASVELTVASFELLDDIQDGDPNPVVAHLGVAQALNVAVGCLLLGQHVLLRLEARGAAPSVVLAVQRELLDAIATAGGGQYLDLAAEAQPAGESMALEVAQSKTAALVAGACRAAARLAEASPDLVDALGEFGWHAGLADQLQNDVDALRTEQPRSDRARGKATLPEVAAEAFRGAADELAPAHAGEHNLAEKGALHYTWIIGDQHRQQARAIATALGADHPTGGLIDLL